MSLLDRITPLQRFTPSLYRSWIVGGEPVGRLRHGFAAALADYPGVFTLTSEAVLLNEALATPEARTAALQEAAEDLARRGVIRPLRGEIYPIKARWRAPELLRADRRLATYFGFRSYGVHVNGFVRRGDGLKLWVGFRAKDKSVAPGKLDNLVAGGQPADLSLAENLVKEAAEEASLARDVAARARPVGALAYLCDWGEEGSKDDLLFLYDLELSAEVTPVNSDGEVERFELWSLGEVRQRLEGSDDFKFNVAPVMIDFLIRHGALTPDDAADYEDLAVNLRRLR